MEKRKITLIGAPVELGAGLRGCAMGPSAMRISDLAAALAALGHDVADDGDAEPVAVSDIGLSGNARNAENIVGWARALEDAAYRTLKAGRLPLFMGGDHALAIGSVSGAARHARELGRPLCVVWLDAHADFNTPATSESGNMHGMPVAYYCGEPGFDGILGHDRATVDPGNVFMLGIRSVDERERQLIAERGVQVFDMRAIDEFGVAPIVRRILAHVERLGALLHVSLDVDFLDPFIAPGVGTTVSGGANLREAHLIMEMLCESGLTTSMDLAELNPYLDDRGKSARLLTDLTASLFGRKVLDKAAIHSSLVHHF